MQIPFYQRQVAPQVQSQPRGSMQAAAAPWDALAGVGQAIQGLGEKGMNLAAKIQEKKRVQNDSTRAAEYSAALALTESQAKTLTLENEKQGIATTSEMLTPIFEKGYSIAGNALSQMSPESKSKYSVDFEHRKLYGAESIKQTVLVQDIKTNTLKRKANWGLLISEGKFDEVRGFIKESELGEGEKLVELANVQIKQNESIENSKLNSVNTYLAINQFDSAKEEAGKLTDVVTREKAILTVSNAQRAYNISSEVVGLQSRLAAATKAQTMDEAISITSGVLNEFNKKADELGMKPTEKSSYVSSAINAATRFDAQNMTSIYDVKQAKEMVSKLQETGSLDARTAAVMNQTYISAENTISREANAITSGLISLLKKDGNGNFPDITDNINAQSARLKHIYGDEIGTQVIETLKDINSGVTATTQYKRGGIVRDAKENRKLAAIVEAVEDGDMAMAEGLSAIMQEGSFSKTVRIGGLKALVENTDKVSSEEKSTMGPLMIPMLQFGGNKQKKELSEVYSDYFSKTGNIAGYSDYGTNLDTFLGLKTKYERAEFIDAVKLKKNTEAEVLLKRKLDVMKNLL